MVEHMYELYFSNKSVILFYIYRVAQKSNPLQNDQKIVINRIKACQ